MADYKIKVKVDGEEQIKKLQHNLEDLNQGAKASSFSFKSLTKVWYASGVALAALVISGTKWKNELDEITGETNTAAQATENATGAFGAASSAILEATHVADAYKVSVNALADSLDGLAIALGGMSNAEKEYLKWKKEEDAWLKESTERQIKDQKKLKAARDDADVNQQKHLSRLDELVAKEKEANDAKAKAEEAAYEALLKKLDAEEQVAQAREEVVQQTQAATEAEEEYADAIEATTQAQQSNFDRPNRGYQSFVGGNEMNRDPFEGAGRVTGFDFNDGYNPSFDALQDIARTNRKMSRGNE